jgi:hypothetical protein
MMYRSVRRWAWFGSARRCAGFWLAVLMGSLAGVPAVAGVPFAGCAGDGQTGPFPAPARIEHVPAVPAEWVGSLAYYAASEKVGVLAPRGWHCFELYGSGGVALYVTPYQYDPVVLSDIAFTISGPAVVWGLDNASNSGRFEVARVIHRLFPDYEWFRRDLMRSENWPFSEFAPDPTHYGRVLRRSDTVVEYRMAGGWVGQGATWKLRPDGPQVFGAAVLQPKSDMNLLRIAVRLPPDLQPLARTIVRSFEVAAQRAAVP